MNDLPIAGVLTGRNIAAAGVTDRPFSIWPITDSLGFGFAFA